MSLNDVNASLLKDIDPIGSANRLCAVSFQDDIAQLRFGNSCLLVDPTNYQIHILLIASSTLESGIDVGQGITVGPGKFVKKNKRRALNKRRA